MRAPPSFFGYQIFAALVLCELCLQLQGRDDLATAVSACVVGGSFSPLFFWLCLLFAGFLYHCHLVMLWCPANRIQSVWVFLISQFNNLVVFVDKKACSGGYFQLGNVLELYLSFSMLS
ncbi:hypothetical protein BDN67DRAFT_372921 [Paxillus ammoniavirescens]|nr:hypothetical protein BDN67DRAFT_372921 [Paxillus ammoniavirescens]